MRRRIGLIVLVTLLVVLAFVSGRSYERLARTCWACRHERHGERICVGYEDATLCGCLVGTVFEVKR